jgi:exosortase D (VPLPA-CTERM-specific)
LLLLIPIPLVILQKVVDPLQLLVVKMASTLLSLAGVPVSRQGNVIHLSGMLLDVTHSGIRSILSLMTVAIMYGYLADNRKWVRVVLACSAVPIAVAANSVRIFGTGLLAQYWDPVTAEGFFHVYSGWLIFVVFLIMLFILHRLISRIWKSSPETKLSVQIPASTTSTPVGMKGWLFRFGTAAVLMLVAALVLQARSRSELLPPRESLSSLPMQIDGWSGQDISLDQQTLDIFKPDEVLLRDYENPSQLQGPINLFIQYSPTRAGAMIHSEENDFLLEGWVPALREVIQIARPGGSSFAANRAVFSKAGDRELVLYWYQSHGRAVASQNWARYYLVADSIRMNRSDGALVRLSTPMSPGESPDAAQARLMKLGSQFLPLLDRYVPR